MPTRCIIGNCSATHADGVCFHRFPKDEEVARKWNQFVKRTRNDWKEHSKRSVVCSLHFTKDDYESSYNAAPLVNIKMKANLKPSATPTVLPGDFQVFKTNRQFRVGGESAEVLVKDEAPQRQLRKLSENNGKFMENWNPETSNREARKMNRKIYKDKYYNKCSVRSLNHYDEKGIHVQSKKDLCDCLDEDCPGCHYPCPKCESPKCGHECRNSRRWIYERIEIEGTDITTKTPLKTA